jgi:hypothetical protein
MMPTREELIYFLKKNKVDPGIYFQRISIR